MTRLFETAHHIVISLPESALEDAEALVDLVHDIFVLLRIPAEVHFRIHPELPELPEIELSGLPFDYPVVIEE